MLLYHGSECIVHNPQFGYGNRHNDYGLGFYCTEDKELAMEWSTNGVKAGYANAYRLSIEDLIVIDLTSSEYNILNWLTILLENRTFSCNTPLSSEAKEYLLKNFSFDYGKADIIRGYRADDSYFTYAKMFLNNGISLEQLSMAMRLGNLGNQFVLKSKQAFERIEFVEAIPVDSIQYGIKRNNRDKKAREDFSRIRQNASKGVYVMDIMREGWTNSDERLQ